MILALAAHNFKITNLINKLVESKINVAHSINKFKHPF